MHGLLDTWQVIESRFHSLQVPDLSPEKKFGSTDIQGNKSCRQEPEPDEIPTMVGIQRRKSRLGESRDRSHFEADPVGIWAADFPWMRKSGKELPRAATTWSEGPSSAPEVPVRKQNLPTRVDVPQWIPFLRPALLRNPQFQDSWRNKSAAIFHFRWLIHRNFEKFIRPLKRKWWRLWTERKVRISWETSVGPTACPSSRKAPNTRTSSP